MFKNGTLKKEMAAAVLALGVASASPVFAQEADVQEAPQATATEVVAANDTFFENSVDFYNGQFPWEWFTLAFALTMAGGGALVYRNREDMGGTVLRVGALATTFCWMANPQIVNDEFRTLPTVFPVFVDQSFSVGDRAPLVEEAFKALEEKLSTFGPVQVQRVEFGTQDSLATNAGTNFAEVFSSAMDEIPEGRLGGSFIISDGIIHDQNHFMDVPYEGPIHALIAGHDQEQDFYIRVKQAPSLAVIGQDQDIVLEVVDARTPDSDDLTARINIYYDGKLVEQLTLPLNQDATITLSDIVPEGLALGDNLLEFTIDEIQGARVAQMDFNGDGQGPDEVSTLNNTAPISIRGIDSNINVLMLSGEPNGDLQLWRSVLNDDPNVTLEHFSYSWPLAKQDGSVPLRERSTYAFPVREVFQQKLDEASIVILNEYSYNAVVPTQYLNMLKDYVENGGGLIVAGRDALMSSTSIARTAIGDVLPMTLSGEGIEGRFTPTISDWGARHPIGQSLLNAGTQPWGAWYGAVSGTIDPDANVVLNDGDGNPVLAIREVGEGRVAMLGTDQTYLWANGHDGGGPAAELYRAISGWTLQNKSFEEEQLNLEHRDGELTISLQTMQDEAVPIIVQTPSGAEIEVTPVKEREGLFTITIPADEHGPYRARRSGEETAQSFVVAGFEDELEAYNVVSDTEVLRPLTDAHDSVTTRITDVSGALTMPAVEVTGQGNAAENGDTLFVNMSDAKETIGAQRQSLPDYAYGLLFAMLLLLSFKPKDQGLGQWASSRAKQGLGRMLPSGSKKNTDDMTAPEIDGP